MYIHIYMYIHVRHDICIMIQNNTHDYAVYKLNNAQILITSVSFTFKINDSMKANYDVDDVAME